MRYRKLSPSGDFSFGQGSANFYINVPEAPGQAVDTRLALILGEWYLDTSDGTPYSTEVLGFGTSRLRDQAIKSRTLATPGISAIASYSSQLDSVTRKFSVQESLDTIYGPTSVSTEL